MIESNILPTKLEMIDENGESKELLVTSEICEMPLIEDEYENEKNSVNNNEITFTCEINTKMTRKKFVKMLMSKGIGRNGAHEIANYVRRKNGRYTLFDLIIW